MGSNFKVSDSARRLATNFSVLASNIGFMTRLRGKRAYAAIVAIVVVVVGLLYLALSPSSQPLQLFGCAGCVDLSDKSATLSHPDGASITLLPGGSLRAELSSIPQDKFLEALAGTDWEKALEALPTNLAVKSPVYLINIYGAQKGQAILSAAIPNDAEPWETLDLYTWTGQEWRWVGGNVDMANEVVSAELAKLPSNVVIMQTSPLAPAVASTVSQAPSGDELAVVNELVMPGLLLGSMGQVQGDRITLALPAEGSAYAMIPAVRNWAQASPKPNVGLVMDMLSDTNTRAEHVKQLVNVVSNMPYAGLQIDYRDVPAESRDAFTDFVAKLAEALHKENKLLSIVLPPPAPTAEGGWDTGGYDWRAIGEAADAVALQPTADPTAYGPNGQAVQIVRWALGQVSRYKLQLAFSALSEEHVGDQVSAVSYQDAIKLFGMITTTTGIQVAPGETVTLKLSGQLQQVAFDESSKIYRLAHSSSGQPSTVYLVTAAALGERLNLAARYNLRGVMVHNLLDAAGSSDARLVTALQQYKDKAAPAVPGALEVVWTVRSQAGAQLPGGSSDIANAQFVWKAPTSPGQYVVAAAIPGASSRGEVPINVLAATPTPLPPTPAPTPTTLLTGNVAAGATIDDDCMDSTYVADVTVPDGTNYENNVGFEKTWRVKNNGTCDWPSGVTIAFESGDKMDGPDTIALGEVKAGQQVEVSVPMKSPAQAGNYKGVWRLKDSAGKFFGEPLSVLIVAGKPAAPVSGGGGGSAPPPVANLGGFEIGGHVAGFGRPDLMKQAGMKWIKVQIHHGEDGSGWISTAHSNGFKILFGTVGDKDQVMSSDYQAQFSQWLAGLAAAGADAIEVWNEPNLAHEWPMGQINGANYTALLTKAYPAIKAANSGTLVISTALAPTGYWGGAGCGVDGCNDDAFLAQMAAAGAANYIDCVGVHHNSGATSPSATSGHPADPGAGHYSWYFWPTLNLYYNAFGGGRKVCFTEFGYLSGEGYPSLESNSPNFWWGKNTTVQNQADWLAEGVSLAANSGKVRLMIVWNVDFTYYGSDPQAGYAIIRPGGDCPACGSLGRVMGVR